MKTAIVPAQITSVEDKVAGSLSLSQLLLLAAPVFSGSAIFILLPPMAGSSPLKIALITAITVAFSLFAIRIKDKILLQWAVILIRYNLRPRYHVFDKNDIYMRHLPKTAPKKTQAKKPPSVKQKKTATELQLELGDVVKLQHVMAHPDANLHFVTDRKGELSVRITEIK